MKMIFPLDSAIDFSQLISFAKPKTWNYLNRWPECKLKDNSMGLLKQMPLGILSSNRGIMTK
jgi:hypothetical protein